MKNQHLVLSILFIGLALWVWSCGAPSPPPAGENGAADALLEEEKKDLLVLGSGFAATAFDSLSTRLKGALQGEGPTGAVAYCQVAAEDILSAVAFTSDRELHPEVRRSSLRWRSPANEPTAKQRNILEFMQRSHLAGEAVEARVELEDHRVHYYQPIFIQPLCLACHGKPGEDIGDETLATIDVLYPNDRARGYRAGDLRGIWHISFDR